MDALIFAVAAYASNVDLIGGTLNVSGGTNAAYSSSGAAAAAFMVLTDHQPSGLEWNVIYNS